MDRRLTRIVRAIGQLFPLLVGWLLARARAVWARISIRAALLAFPPSAWLLTFKGVDAQATPGFFEASAQIIPLLLLVLAVEARAFRIGPGATIRPSVLRARAGGDERRAFSAFARLVYLPLVLLALAAGELAALHAIAKHSVHWYSHGNAKPVYAAIVSGLSLAVVAGLISLDDVNSSPPGEERTGPAEPQPAVEPA